MYKPHQHVITLLPATDGVVQWDKLWVHLWLGSIIISDLGHTRAKLWNQLINQVQH